MLVIAGRQEEISANERWRTQRIINKGERRTLRVRFVFLSGSGRRGGRGSRLKGF